MSKSVSRLYNNFQPDNYKLRIKIVEKNNKTADTFKGTVEIHGRKTGRPSKRLTFHQNGLKILSAEVIKHDKNNSSEVKISRINNQNSLHEVRLHSDSMIYPGSYTVKMNFEAPLTAGMTGIYPCNFNHDGEDKRLYATQFESHHAREAFPCIDEPEAKATFDLKIVTSDGLTVLGNMPIKSERQPEEDAGCIETEFETTPQMSTYLLAFVIGDVHKLSGGTKSGVDVNVWATKTQPTESLAFALDTAIKSIEYFEDYFGVAYPLPKADHVALPDFSSGAMENWGLITYRERLLVADDSTAQSTKEQIALVIAHETSHMWFGNLVTMRWWNDLWLNESFANMMEYQCVDSFYPEWKVWETFIANEALSAFRRDCLFGVQSVRTDVHHPDEISSLFDPSIVYAKGGRLLYMMKNYIGETAFREGLTAYFKKHSFKNTEANDLWESLGASSGKDIVSFMTPWLTQSGFPVLEVSNDSKDSFTLKQKHFLDNPAKADSERLWPVPLFSSDESAPALLGAREQKITSTAEGALIFNQGGKGHYLVRYESKDHFKAITEAIRSGSISTPDRLLTLNSSSMFARSGLGNYGDTLRLLDAYRDESSEPVWDIMAIVVGEAKRFLDHDVSLEPKLRTFYETLASKQAERLGWAEKTGESAADIKLRALALSMMLYADDKDHVLKAEKLAEDFVKHQKALPSELRPIILSIPIKNGDKEVFNALLELHDSTTSSDLKNDLSDALTATRDPELAEQLLERIKNPALVKPQDADRWLVYLLRNRFTRSTAWDWMVKNWQWLEDTFKNDKSYDYLPRYAATCVNTEEYRQKFDDLFLDKINQPILKRNIELGREETASRVAWLERDLGTVQAFFK